MIPAPLVKGLKANEWRLAVIAASYVPTTSALQHYILLGVLPTGESIRSKQLINR